MFDSVPVFYQYVILAGIGLAGSVVGLWLYNRREGRRRVAIEGASMFKEWGFDWLASFLTCYAIGDYSGMFAMLRELVVLLKHPKAMVEMLEGVAKKVAAYYAANDPTKAAELMKILQSKPAA